MSFKKIFTIVLLLVPVQAIAYNYKTYTYDDIKLIKDNSDKHIFRYCQKENLDLKTCFLSTKKKFHQSLNIYSVEDYGSKFLDYCYNKELLINYDFKKFNNCINDKISLVSIKTAKPSINHHFVINDEMNSLIYNLCNSKHPFFNTAEKNLCINEQEKSLIIFKSRWFKSRSNRIEKIKFGECIEKFSNYDKFDRFMVDFKGTLKCVDSI